MCGTAPFGYHSGITNPFLEWYIKEIHHHETSQWIHAFQKASGDVAKVAGIAKTVHDLDKGAWAVGRAIGPFLI